MNIVLISPEIPMNTGNIARTCAATGSSLHIVKPIGFSIDDKHVKRAGLDYWYLVDIHVYRDINEFFEKNPGGRFWFCTTKAPNTYAQVSYGKDDFLVFGRETKGLDEQLLRDNLDKTVRIPMVEQSRSLNLANSVAIILYEALRQQDFTNLSLSPTEAQHSLDS